MTRNTPSRPHPVIPDHEVLRKIGGGAYGEVWLARGVTGALRAVKVVWREDFEEERGFEREFEGILKYEPISRDHPALVNILHVGRSPDGRSFYYYVMELGDDVASGQDINPIEYEPRTLRADHRMTPGVRWPTDECIDVGLRLAEALHHLHETGLAHRDVKPSNVIFVNGRAKLADIGLVAPRGQMTFVGTEGFVPPEGPGSAQADVYSLGKVLYEIATGKDRMEFPELPDDPPPAVERKRWMALNRIICEVCEPRVSKRKITKASELAEELRCLQRGRRRHRGGAFAVWATTALLVGFSMFALWEAGDGRAAVERWLATFSNHHDDDDNNGETGMLRVVSIPEGAEVLSQDGRLVGVTPTQTMEAAVGSEVVFLLRKPGYRTVELREYLPRSAVIEPHVMFNELQVFAPPVPGDIWYDHLGNAYQPVEGGHTGSGFVGHASWGVFRETVDVPDEAFAFVDISQDGQPSRVVLATRDAADAFAAWLTEAGFEAGYLTRDHEALASRDTSFRPPEAGPEDADDERLPFRIHIREIPFGTMEIVSDPPGAEVFLNGRPVGAAHDVLVLQRIRPGPVELLLELEGYKPLTFNLSIGEGQLLPLNVAMEENQSVVFGKSWRNGIGMEFAPVGPDLMASIWETRVADYALFTHESGYEEPPPPGFQQEPDHPVVNVSRDDAKAFAAWLTRRERLDGRIAVTHEYRLPTDVEWSAMAGLRNEPGISPGGRDARRQPFYPWGPQWPADGAPPVGNFADTSAAMVPGIPLERTIRGYEDGFPYTSPVGRFPPNEYGLFDMSGNAQEWVLDDYSTQHPNPLGVLRGGGWNTYHKHNLHAGSRNAVPPDRRDVMYGFRVVLAKIAPDDDGDVSPSNSLHIHGPDPD